MDPDTRRYDDEQLALVLRRAVELERNGHATPPALRPSPAGGFTATDIRSIAAEAGIDAGAVERALRTFDVAPPSGVARLAGGPVHLRRDATLPGRLTDEVHGRLVGRIRREAAHHGVVVPEGGTLVWRTVGQPTQLDVVVEPDEGSARVAVTADRKGSAGLTVFGSFAAWLVGAGITGAVLDPTGGAGAALILGTAVAGGAATARTLWAWSTRRLRDRMDRLLEAVAEGLDAPPG